MKNPSPSGWIVVLVLGSLLLFRLWPQRTPPPEPLTIQQVQSLASLVSTRITVAEITEARLRGFVGGIKAVLMVHGEILLGVDLQQARFTELDSGSRSAVLLLPPPAVVSVRLDHTRTRLYGIDPYGLWAMAPGERVSVEVVNRAYSEAESAVAKATADPALAVQARTHAEEVLKQFVASLGWRLTIRWIEPPTSQSTHT